MASVRGRAGGWAGVANTTALAPLWRLGERQRRDNGEEGQEGGELGHFGYCTSGGEGLGILAVRSTSVSFYTTGRGSEVLSVPERQRKSPEYPAYIRAEGTERRRPRSVGYA